MSEELSLERRAALKQSRAQQAGASAMREQFAEQHRNAVTERTARWDVLAEWARTVARLALTKSLPMDVRIADEEFRPSGRLFKKGTTELVEKAAVGRSRSTSSVETARPPGQTPAEFQAGSAASC